MAATEGKIIEEFLAFDIQVQYGSPVLDKREWESHTLREQTGNTLATFTVDENQVKIGALFTPSLVP